MTSASIPCSADRRSAASTARGTMDASATIVQSPPSRTMAALPSGTTCSPSGTSPLVASSAFDAQKMTGSGSRIEATIRPRTSAGVDGATTLSPGIAIAQFSIAWLCWAPNRSPAPFAVWITSGNETWPSVM